MVKSIHEYENQLAELERKKASLESRKTELSDNIARCAEKNREILKQVHQINHPQNFNDDFGAPLMDVVVPRDLKGMREFAKKERLEANKIKRKHTAAADHDKKDQVNPNKHDPDQVNLLLSNSDEEMFEQDMCEGELQDIDSAIAKLDTRIAEIRAQAEQDNPQILQPAAVQAQPDAAVVPQAAEDDDIVAVSASSSSSLPSSLSSRSSISTISTLADGNGTNDPDEDARKRRTALFNLLNTELTTYANDNTSSRTEMNKLERLREALSSFDKAKYKPSILAQEQAILVLLNQDINQQLTAPFHAFLNRMKLAILNHDYQFMDLEHNKLDRYLAVAPQSISQNIRALYAQLHRMKEYGQKLKEPALSTVTNLAKDLTRDLDDFIVRTFDPDHLTEPLSPGDIANHFNDFKERFTARLHTQDQLMAQHTKKWRPMVANILAGVATLGIALGVKLVYSKLKEGHASFFMSKTGKEQHVKRVEDTLRNFDDKPNKGPGNNGG